MLRFRILIQHYGLKPNLNFFFLSPDANAGAIKQFDGPEANNFGRLLMTYGKIVDLNTQIAKIMYDESLSVVELATIFDIIVSAAICSNNCSYFTLKKINALTYRN